LLLSAIVLALPGALLPACRPELGDRESLVTGTRVLAVRGEPPEAKPGEVVRYSLLVATPEGPVTNPSASWAFCATPKLLTENGAATAACLKDAVRPLAEGTSSIEAVLPADACALFGPEITSAELRPRDPDVTGGYYQPLRVSLARPQAGASEGEGAVAFGLERIACNLANAAAEVTADFGRRYAANRNPELGPLTATRDGVPVALDAIPRGARVQLRASWPEGAAERYVVYDLASRTVIERRETMRVSWFTTAGTFASDRTGRSEDELEPFTDNEWTAPDEARSTDLFVVLRDARGGVAFATHELVTR
jgi:hypothetical protein